MIACAGGALVIGAARKSAAIAGPAMDSAAAVPRSHRCMIQPLAYGHPAHRARFVRRECCDEVAIVGRLRESICQRYHWLTELFPGTFRRQIDTAARMDVPWQDRPLGSMQPCRQNTPGD